MKTSRKKLWALPELAAEVALALSRLSLDQASGRVREVPNARTIRYYTTAGLLDRPEAFEGRTALYSRKHFLQLVAIKQLQARGHSLAEIQQRLHGLRADELEQIAELSQTRKTDSKAATQLDTSFEEEARPPPAESLPALRDTAFWLREPAPLEDLPPSSAERHGIPERKQSLGESFAPKRVEGVSLHRDVTLLFGALKRPLHEEDLHAIQAASEPLLALLRARHLIE